MIGSFSTALGTALTAFVTDVQAGITANVPTVLGVTLGLIGIFLLWRVVKRFAGGK